jgi:hypothetical protein
MARRTSWTILGTGALCALLVLVARHRLAAAEALRASAPPPGGLVTLYTLDPLARTFCFGDGEYGNSFEAGETRNRASDIDYSGYVPGSLSVGIEGGRQGRIIDLGPATALKERYGYEETVGNGQGYASIHRDGKRLMILKQRGARQELTEADALFREKAGQSAAKAALGHIYLVRITDTADPAFERLVKVMVVGHREGESVTIRWNLL